MKCRNFQGFNFTILGILSLHFTLILNLICIFNILLHISFIKLILSIMNIDVCYVFILYKYSLNIYTFKL